jgi:hypothetical protein
MSNHIYVLCKSLEHIEYNVVVSRIEAFDDIFTIEPPSLGRQMKATDWVSFEVRYATSRRPIQIERITERARVNAIAADEVERLDAHIKSTGATGPSIKKLRQELRKTKQIFHFEFGDISERIWEMLDDAESALAKALDGIVGASDGFYDKGLRPIFTWRK